MKQQIARFSPHQNGKVFAVLAAVGSLVFMIPFMLFAFMGAPEGARPPVWFLVGMPLIYLTMGYVSVAIGCAVYNAMHRYIGGIEFETKEMDD